MLITTAPPKGTLKQPQTRDGKQNKLKKVFQYLKNLGKRYTKISKIFYTFPHLLTREMAFKFPDSVEDLVYWTNRKIGGGKVVAWVEKELCPKCNKGTMGKPVDSKGKVKIRAKEYVCPECNNEIPKTEYENTLTVKCVYSCPYCKKEGEIGFPFERKTYKGTKALVFECKSCKEKIPITKKFKDVKK